MERLWLAAWLDGLHRVAPAPELPLVELPRRVALDDTGRPPTVPLRGAQDDER